MSGEEARLIQRAKQRDPAALTQIYEQYQPKVYRYILYRVGDADLAGDLTSEVFLRLVEQIGRFTYRGRPILAWLYTIARNLVADHYRRAQRAASIPLDNLPPSATAEPSDPIQQWLTQHRLAQALSCLTDEQYEVILLRFLEGLDLETVAEQLGKSVRAVKSLQYRGLRALRRTLGKNGW